MCIRDRLNQARAGAEAEREQRLGENAGLAERQKDLAEARTAALAQAQTIATQAQSLRQQLAALETELKTGRCV